MNTKFHSFNGLDDVEAGVKFLDFDGSDVESGNFDEFSVKNSNSDEQYSNIIGIVAAVRINEANKLLKNLTIAEKQRFEQIKQEQVASGVRDTTGMKAKGKLALEILKRKDSEVDSIKDRLIREKKANKVNAKSRAKNIWEDQRKALLAQEAKLNQIAPSSVQTESAQIEPTSIKSFGLGKKVRELKGSQIKLSKDSPLLKSTIASPLEEKPATEVSTPLPNTGSNTDSDDSESKPNYLLWGGIGLAVLTLGFLAYRKFYSK